MLLELYDLGLEARALQVLAGLVLGLVFGAAAQITRFCLRRAIAGAPEERAAAASVWFTALFTGLLAFAGAQVAGLVDLQGHRLMSSELPLAALVIGGLAFGIGMVLTRGCASRLTVLAGTGNLRAAAVLLTFAVVAHATLKGVLAPLREGLGAWTVPLPIGSLFEVPVLFAAAILAALSVPVLFWKGRPPASHLVLGGVIGLVAVLGWSLTSVLLMDEFDPLPVQTAAFTLPWTDGLFWVIASSAIPAGFGVGWLAGVLGGSFLSAASRGELALQSFSNPSETLRYVAGGGLMGLGGVLAGGCTVGAGLSGISAGSVSAIVVLFSIMAGALLATRLDAIGARRALAAA